VKLLRLMAVVVAAVAVAGTMGLAQTRIRAAFIYVGPIGDYGWSFAHNQGRLMVERELGIETTYVERVTPGELETYIDLLVAQGFNVIFTTSFGFMDGTLAAAQRHPNVIFAHCSGFRRAPNVMTYMADFYQAYYLAGLMAGALTETGKIGYIAAFPIPEVKRHLNTFAIAARTINPQATIHVRWTYAWFNPPAAKEATEALIAEGADVFMFTEDSPTVATVAAAAGFPSFSHYSPMLEFAPDHVVSGKLAHWGVIYVDFLRRVIAGEFTATNLQHVDYFWTIPQGAVELGATYGMPINPKFEARLRAKVVEIAPFGRISVYDLVHARLRQFGLPGYTYDPFQGPIYDRKGVLRVPEGFWLSYESLITMRWAAEGVVGPWPGEP
jgi:simple sugar transport system substrate-binding protein